MASREKENRSSFGGSEINNRSLAPSSLFAKQTSSAWKNPEILASPVAIARKGSLAAVDETQDDIILRCA